MSKKMKPKKRDGKAVRIPIHNTYFDIQEDQYREAIEAIYYDQVERFTRNDGELLREFGASADVIRRLLETPRESIENNAAALAKWHIDHPEVVGASFLYTFIEFAQADLRKHLLGLFSGKDFPYKTKKQFHAGVKGIKKWLTDNLPIIGRTPKWDHVALLREYKELCPLWRNVTRLRNKLSKAGEPDILAKLEKQFPNRPWKEMKKSYCFPHECGHFWPGASKMAYLELASLHGMINDSVDSVSTMTRYVDRGRKKRNTPGL